MFCFSTFAISPSRGRAARAEPLPHPATPPRSPPLPLTTQGAFKDWLKATQKGARRTWHDPARHDWDVLAAFVASVSTKGGAWEALARRHLAWSRWAARRDEWSAWQADQPAAEVPREGPWSLVARTRAHASYDETYARLPSYLPGWARSKRQRPPRWCQSKNLPPRMLGVDCEMCETSEDPRALVGVSVVDESGAVLLQTLVKPPGRIVDLKSEVTGLRLADLKGVKTTLEDVQAELRAFVAPNVVLVGHGLVHDLRALKFDHLPVIDTACLFAYENLPRSTPALADLCKRLLGEEMRVEDGTHDSTEDAKMALRLARWECEHGPTNALTPPEDKVDKRDLVKLFVHRVPRGALEGDVRGMFAKANGTIGVDHLEDVVAVRGKALGPETKPDGSGRTTSAYVEFKSVDACNAAFKALRGAQGTDALGRPQKSVKMVVTNERAARTRGAKEARRGGAETEAAKMPNFSKTTVVELRKALAKRGLSEEGLKPALVERLREAMEKEAGGGGAKGGDAKTKTAAEKVSPIPANVSRLTVAELRKALEARGLATDGLKAALVARLEEARDAAGGNSDEDSDAADDDDGAVVTRTVMVRKMAAHLGRAIGAVDKNAGGDAGTPRTGEKRKPGAAAGGSADAKKPRRVPRPSRRARLAAKGIYE